MSQELYNCINWPKKRWFSRLLPLAKGRINKVQTKIIEKVKETGSLRFNELFDIFIEVFIIYLYFNQKICQKNKLLIKKLIKLF